MSDFIMNGVWLLPPPISNHLIDIGQTISSLEAPQPEFEDEVIWKNNDQGFFTLKSFLDLNANALPTNRWIPMIWFKGRINKNSVCF